MTLLFMDGFDDYSSGSDLHVSWHSSGQTTISTLTKKTGRASVNLQSSLDLMQWLFPSTYTTNSIFVGVATRISWMSGASLWSKLISFRYGRDTGQISLEIERSTKQLRIINSTGSITNTHAASFAHIESTFVYFEIGIGISSSSSGTYELRMNGSPLLKGTGITNPDALGIDRVELRSGGVAVHFDDFYICDSLGVRNNTFLVDPSVGAKAVNTLGTNGDGHLVQWSRSGGTTNSENVDEDVHNEDTDYVYGDANNEEDFYLVANLPAGIPSGSINGVQVDSWSANSNETETRRLRHSLYLSAQASYGSVLHEPGVKWQTTPAGGSMYAKYHTVFEQTPSSQQFLPTNVDAIEVGQKMEA